MWCQVFLTLSTQNSEYLISFSKFLWKHAKPDSYFPVAKISIFGIFDHFQRIHESPKKLKKKKKKQFSREHFGSKTKTIPQNLRGKFLRSCKLVFKKKQNPLIFGFAMTSPAGIFYLYQNYTIAVKYNHLEIFGEISSNLVEICVGVGKNCRFTAVFSWLIYIHLSD